MFTPAEIMQLIYSMIWLLAGVGIFIVGMNFMGEALENAPVPACSGCWARSSVTVSPV